MTDFGRRVAAAAANILPKTGQTTPYVDYDDGYYEKGWDVGERFTDNGDGTVTDNATGLMWPTDFNGAGMDGLAGWTLQQTLDFAEALDFAGHQDWRIPNFLEAYSLLNLEDYNLALYDIFDNAVSVMIWTSTTDKANPGQGNLVDTSFGLVYRWNKTWAVGMALPVRTA